MAVLCNQGLCTNPFGIGSNKSIGRFQAGKLIFVSKFKRNNKILVNEGHPLDKGKDFAKDLAWEVAADFFNNHSRDSNSMGSWSTDKQIE